MRRNDHPSAVCSDASKRTDPIPVLRTPRAPKVVNSLRGATVPRTVVDPRLPMQATVLKVASSPTVLTVLGEVNTLLTLTSLLDRRLTHLLFLLRLFPRAIAHLAQALTSAIDRHNLRALPMLRKLRPRTLVLVRRRVLTAETTQVVTRALDRLYDATDLRQKVGARRTISSAPSRSP